MAEMIDDIETLRIALVACADSLEGELKACYGDPVHPALLKKWNSDMQDVYEARKALSALDRLQARVSELERKDAEWRRISIKQSNEIYAQKVQRDKIEAERDSLRAKLERAKEVIFEAQKEWDFQESLADDVLSYMGEAAKDAYLSARLICCLHNILLVFPLGLAELSVDTPVQPETSPSDPT